MINRLNEHIFQKEANIFLAAAEEEEPAKKKEKKKGKQQRGERLFYSQLHILIKQDLDSVIFF